MKLPGISLAFLLLSALLLCGCSRSKYTPGERVLQDSLNRVMDRHDEIISGKMDAIERIHRSSLPSTPKEAYDKADRLYGEFYSFDFDSAAYYASRKMELAAQMGNRKLLDISRINRARVILEIGRMAEADSLIALVDTVPDTDVRISLLDYKVSRAETNNLPAIPYFKEMDSLMPHGSRDWIMNRSNLLRSQGEYRKALEILEKHLPELETSERNKGIVRFMMGRLQLQTGDTIAAINNLLRSSAADLAVGVRDYRSLATLAETCFDTGNVSDAYRYLNLAIADLSAANVAPSMISLSRLTPEIASAYDMQRRRTTLILSLTIGIILLLAVALVFLWRRDIRIGRKAAADAAALEKSNARLEDTVKRLNSLNVQLEDANKVKEAYILEFISLSSSYIDALTDYRTQLRAIARKDGAQAAIVQLSDTEFDEKQRESLYRSFDQTFLGLYPDFIEKFNELLVPEKRIILRQKDSLTTELRVFALIKLGITDSEKIARFLRRSISTVYNYRVKMRNSALGNREDFEKNL